VFPFAVEIVIVSLVLLFLVVQIAAEHDPNMDATTTKVIERVLIGMGGFLLASFAVRALFDLDGFLSRENLERVLVAPLLAVAFIPFLCLVAWYSQRELANLRRQFSL
jgi:hypothetical protein